MVFTRYGEKQRSTPSAPSASRIKSETSLVTNPLPTLPATRPDISATTETIVHVPVVNPQMTLEKNQMTESAMPTQRQDSKRPLLRRFSDDQIKKVIATVETIPAIWCHAYPHFKETSRLFHGWRKVAEEVNVSVTTAKQIWRALKDYYRKLYNPIAQEPQSAPNLQARFKAMKWRFYLDMSFLSENWESQEELTTPEPQRPSNPQPTPVPNIVHSSKPPETQTTVTNNSASRRPLQPSPATATVSRGPPPSRRPLPPSPATATISSGPPPSKRPLQPSAATATVSRGPPPSRRPLQPSTTTAPVSNGSPPKRLRLEPPEPHEYESESDTDSESSSEPAETFRDKLIRTMTESLDALTESTGSGYSGCSPTSNKVTFFFLLILMMIEDESTDKIATLLVKLMKYCAMVI